MNGSHKFTNGSPRAIDLAITLPYLTRMLTRPRTRTHRASGRHTATHADRRSLVGRSPTIARQPPLTPGAAATHGRCPRPPHGGRRAQPHNRTTAQPHNRTSLDTCANSVLSGTACLLPDSHSTPRRQAHAQAMYSIQDPDGVTCACASQERPSHESSTDECESWLGSASCNLKVRTLCPSGASIPIAFLAVRLEVR